jgi:hypothetical protein
MVAVMVSLLVVCGVDKDISSELQLSTLWKNLRPDIWDLT